MYNGWQRGDRFQLTEFVLVVRAWEKDFPGLVIPVETLCKVINPHQAEETHNKKLNTLPQTHSVGKQQSRDLSLSPEYSCRLGSSVGQIQLALQGSSVTV